ncbi:Gfo/Idh/MocA family oxidoreductase [uncultured Paraglaciecola sp.]|uniref:Gfo/Idh/MocA family oxidoreductase n=1 Tax=uncultured Paraglaciecola sp. TaxID=1765024 RepID=UPI0026234AB1|nr:Gfo/Idh/MocA family oxidoreductase [uncultured Paraglaciecola sp.]
MNWLIGAGPMAIEYAKVLQAQHCSFMCIARGEASASTFYRETGIKADIGGLQHFLQSNPEIPEHAIVATGIESLAHATELLLNYGVKSILVEKPAGLDIEEVERTQALADSCQANVFVAYNRRFYASVIAAQKMIAEDGGVTSLNYEITEWSQVIEKLDIPANIKRNWFIANTSHVVDLAFYLGGKPQELASFTEGQTAWHPDSANFAGAGITEKNALFAYHGNWNAPGRWSVEVLTTKHRFIFTPLETLNVQRLGEINIVNVPIDNTHDLNFKPGVFLQGRAFLNNNFDSLCSINEHRVNLNHYCQMANYDL